MSNGETWALDMVRPSGSVIRLHTGSREQCLNARKHIWHKVTDGTKRLYRERDLKRRIEHRPGKRRGPGDLIDIRKQAKCMAEHIKRTGQRTLHLWPLTIGTSINSEFQCLLLCWLTEGCEPRYHTSPSDAQAFRRQAERDGYTIVEIDPNDYRLNEEELNDAKN